MKKKVNLQNVFKTPPRKPFSLELNFNIENPTTEKLFNKIVKLYKKGLSIQLDPTEKYNHFSIKSVKVEHIEKMKKYMLSLGISAYYRVYTEYTLDILFKEFLYEIEKIENLDIRTLIDWKTKYVSQIMVKYKNNDQKGMEQFIKYVLKFNKVNMFFKFIKPSRLKDYSFIVKDQQKKITHLIYFDFANPSDYNIEYSS